ncbi:GNAT family N-acetyltransferase [Candidatus Dojkabacteria bacterium]|nr:GNAT family N-acetyltransferase [Candidatus Dojkabacteria bacterium]
MQIRIIKPEIKDLDRLIPLWEEQYKYHHDLDSDYYVTNSEDLTNKFREYLTKSIEKNDPYILVALLDGEYAGFITFKTEEADYFDTNIKKFGSIIELYVSGKYRRKGIGTKLMESVENFFKEKGLEWVELQCSSYNEMALIFYDKSEFKNRQTLLFKRIS